MPRPLRHGPVGPAHRRHQGGRRRGRVRADRLRDPGHLEPVGHQRRGQQVLLRRGGHQGARDERPALDPPRHAARSPIGASQDGYFATAEDGERFYRDLTWLCLHQHASFNSPVWFNVGLYHQYGVKGAMCNWHWDQPTGTVRPAGEPLRVSPGLGLLHPERPGQHGRHHGAGPQRGHALQVRLRHGHRPVDAPLAPREALRRRQALGAAVVHAGLRPDRRGGQERRQDPPGRQDAVAQGLAPRHPGVHRVQVQGGEEGPAADRQGLRSRGGLQLGPLPERQPLGPRDRRVHGGGRGRQAVDHALGHRAEQARAPPTRPARCSRQIAEAAWACGDPGVQYDTTINRWHTCPNSGRINASNPCSRVHVPRRLGLQPGEHQPDEVPPRGRHVRRRAVPGGLPAGVHRPGDPRRSRQLSDQADRRQQPPLPPDRAGLLEPRQPDHGQRPALRFGRGPRAVRRDHRPAARGGLPHQHRAGRGGRAVRRLRGEPRADAPRDGDALGEGRADPATAPEYLKARRPQGLGRGARRRAAATASATPRPRCWPRPARSAS